MSGYTDFQADMAQLLATDLTNTKFVELLPWIINSAEARIYRELDFLAQRTYRTVDLVANQRTIGLPQTTKILVVLESAFVITPPATAPDAGKRNPLRRVSPDLIDFLAPSLTDVPAALPRYIALDDEQTARFAPVPNAAYKIELRGTYRPDPLNSTTTTDTYLTGRYYDLFVACAMIFGSGYQKSFGAMADDPKMALSWEATYANLRASAQLEAFRQKGQSQGWTPYMPSPVASPRT